MMSVEQTQLFLLDNLNLNYQLLEHSRSIYEYSKKQSILSSPQGKPKIHKRKETQFNLEIAFVNYNTNQKTNQEHIMSDQALKILYLNIFYNQINYYNSLLEYFYNFSYYKIDVMNMAERAEDIDYQPDVLKFKQIWEEINETNQQKPLKNPQHQVPTRTKSKIEPKTKDHSKLREKERELFKHSREQSKQQKQQKQPKKQTIVSQKNISRNPKHDPEKVVQVITNPQGFYQNSLRNMKSNVQKEVLIQTSVDQSGLSQINNLKRTLQQKDHELSLLRVNNITSKDRIKDLQQQVAQKNQRIWQLQARQRQLLSRNSALVGTEKLFDYGKIQYENFRNDTRRLLKMLQTTNQYQQFANLALDDNGVRFLNEVNKKIKSSIDSKQKTALHFCTCNKQFISQSGFWVPQKVYTLSKQFVKKFKGHMTQSQLELMLYDINKIWREREKRIINTLNSQKAKEVDFLKRKLTLHKSNSAKE